MGTIRSQKWAIILYCHGSSRCKETEDLIRVSRYLLLMLDHYLEADIVSLTCLEPSLQGVQLPQFLDADLETPNIEKFIFGNINSGALGMNQLHF